MCIKESSEEVIATMWILFSFFFFLIILYEFLIIFLVDFLLVSLILCASILEHVRA
jgi:hypothetical protein